MDDTSPTMATDGERATEEIQWWPYLFLPCILLIAFIWTRTSYRRKLAAQLDTVAAAELAAAAHVSTLRSQYHLGELSGGWLLRATEVHPRGKRGGSITHNYQATLQLHFAPDGKVTGTQEGSLREESRTGTVRGALDASTGRLTLMSHHTHGDVCKCCAIPCHACACPLYTTVNVVVPPGALQTAYAGTSSTTRMYKADITRNFCCTCVACNIHAGDVTLLPLKAGAGNPHQAPVAQQLPVFWNGGAMAPAGAHYAPATL